MSSQQKLTPPELLLSVLDNKCTFIIFSKENFPYLLSAYAFDESWTKPSLPIAKACSPVEFGAVRAVYAIEMCATVPSQWNLKKSYSGCFSLK